jgi:hypothetical protein
LGPAQQKVKLEELSVYAYDLIMLFEKDSIVNVNEPYQLLVRLFQEQCEINQAHEVQLKKKTEGESLQSPYEPDASYGHKGTGYSVHITETCNNPDKPEIITDYI